MEISRLRLKTQMISLVIVLLTLIVSTAIIAINGLSGMGKELKEVAEIDIPLAEIVTKITENQLEQAIRYERMLRYADNGENDAEKTEKFKQAVKEFRAYTQPIADQLKVGEKIAAEGIGLSLNERTRKEFKTIEKTLLEIEKGHAEYERHVGDVLKKIEQGETQEAFVLAEKVTVEEEELNHKIEAFLNTIEAFTEESLLIAEQHEQSVIVYLTVIVIASIAFGLMFSYLIVRTIQRQIGGEPAMIQKIANDVATGHFDIEQSDAKATGIFCELIQMSNSLKEAIKAIQDTMNSIATGDFTNRLDGEKMTGELSLISEAINNSVTMLSNTILEVSNTSEQINIGAEQLSSTSQALANGTTEQASSLEQITSSMSEIGNKARMNTDNAIQASSLTSQTLEIVKRGIDQMELMLSAMDKINNSSADISKIIKVIDEIAFQTNLLALNAAVEAARAGKYGKGFAVVAEEVRSLAGRSTQAAKNTTELIENSVKEVELGVSNADKTADILNEIDASISKANDLVEEITSASKEQVSNTDEINSALNQVNTVIQQNSSISEQTAAASEELNGQSVQLKELMDQFKLRLEKPRVTEKIEVKREAQKRIDPPPKITHEPPSPPQLETPKAEQPEIPLEIPLKRRKIITLDDDNFGKY